MRAPGGAANRPLSRVAGAGRDGWLHAVSVRQRGAKLDKNLPQRQPWTELEMRLGQRGITFVQVWADQ